MNLINPINVAHVAVILFNILTFIIVHVKKYMSSLKLYVHNRTVNVIIILASVDALPLKQKLPCKFVSTETE